MMNIFALPLKWTLMFSAVAKVSVDSITYPESKLTNFMLAYSQSWVMEIIFPLMKRFHFSALTMLWSKGIIITEHIHCKFKNNKVVIGGNNVQFTILEVSPVNQVTYATK